MLLENYPSMYNKISKFVNTPYAIIYCFKNDIREQPICQLQGCSNPIKFSKSSKFAKGCCTQHSQEITFLEKYGVSNPMKSAEVKERLKQTNLEKYGVENYFQTEQSRDYSKNHNAMKNHKVKEKLKQTMLKKYGVENPMQLPEIVQKVSKTHKKIYKEYRDKVKQTNLKKYGVQNPLQNKEIHEKTRNTQKINKFNERILNFPGITPLFTFEDYKGVSTYSWECTGCGNQFQFKIEDGHIPICRKCHPFEKNPYSQGEKELVDWLKSLGLEIIENDRTILNGKEVDILIPLHHVAIEFNGLYWHSELRGKDKTYHLNKTFIADEKGFRLVHVLDTDWYNSKEIVKSIILKKLGIFKTIMDVDNCYITEIDGSTSDWFLKENNIFGTVEAKYRFGLFRGTELMQVLAINRENDLWTIERNCGKLGTCTHHMTTLLLEYFVENYKPKKIVALVKKDLFNGNSYQSFGFEHTADELPTALYFKGTKELIDGKNFINDTWSEIQRQGYNRIWDCGNHKFEWTKKSS